MTEPTTLNTMFTEMIKLQDQVNSTVSGKGWGTKGHLWHLAAIEESVELLGSTSWYWWKSTEYDLENIYVELVDLMAFSLSYHIERTSKKEVPDLVEYMVDRAVVAEKMFNPNKPDKKKISDLRDATLEFMADATKNKYLSLTKLLAMIMMTMAFEDFYKLFIGKAMLNLFRQHNGYKAGEYKKMWGGVEDNAFMEKIVSESDIKTLTEDPQSVYKQLEVEYAKVLDGK
jgi:hypothetical protein